MLGGSFLLKRQKFSTDEKHMKFFFSLSLKHSLLLMCSDVSSACPIPLESRERGGGGGNGSWRKARGK